MGECMPKRSSGLAVRVGASRNYLDGNKMMPRTTRDLQLTLWGAAVTLPKGTAVTLVKGGSGTEGDVYAVRDTALLVKLTGNRHDPRYRYAFVPTDAVEQRPEGSIL